MIIDSWAWIEFLKYTEKGRKVEGFLFNERCYTCLTSLAEIMEWTLKNGLQKRIETIKDKIKTASTIINLNEQAATLAAEINYQRKKSIKNWGIMDSFVVATSIITNLKILTGDDHFKDLPNVEML